MNNKSVEKLWDRNAEIDSMRSIVARNDKPQDWMWGKKAFFDSGFDEIQGVLNYIDSLNLNLVKQRALDFGCGIGRLTQALGRHFEEVFGVDISSAMIGQATELNKFENCKYLHNTKADLSLFKSNQFNLIYSNLVLQHIQPEISLVYITEFIRVLRPEGLLIFQLPCGRNDNSLSAIKNLIQSVIPLELKSFYINRIASTKLYYDMYFIEREEVISQITDNKGTVIDIVVNDVAPGYISLRYCVKK